MKYFCTTLSCVRIHNRRLGVFDRRMEHKTTTAWLDLALNETQLHCSTSSMKHPRRLEHSSPNTIIVIIKSIRSRKKTFLHVYYICSYTQMRTVGDSFLPDEALTNALLPEEIRLPLSLFREGTQTQTASCTCCCSCCGVSSL